MGTILASAIITKINTILQDDGTHWTSAELLGWLNEGQREVVVVKPEVSVVNDSLTLVEGTEQTIPSAGIILLDVIRNSGPGKVVRKVLKDTLDELFPDWHTDTPSAVVKFCCAETNNPKKFYVYPPQPDADQGSVDIVYSVCPDVISATTSPITIDDIYEGCLVDYCVYRAWTKDADYAADPARATAHYQKFLATLTAKDQSETKK